jgi:ubiquitin C-terminal hydrolase
MNFEKYNNKGLNGLTNLGNTCFLNSIMQVISHTYEFNNFLDLQTYKSRLNNKYDSILLLEWDNLRKLLWNNESNCVVTPIKFVNAVQKIATIKNQELFTGFEQNDITEYLIFIVDCFHNALSREVNMSIIGTEINDVDKIAVKCFETIKKIYSNDYSEIWDMFYGIHVSQLTSVKSGEVMSITPEPYFMIDLPIPENNKNITLIDCFDLYVKEEIMDGDNSILNETTGKKESARKSIMFWSFPNILVIDIKRFNAANKKKQMLVDFPLENLNLSKYVIGYNKDTYIYDLYGVCNHSGTVMGGHYTSFIKNANGKWYHCNDTSVSEVGILHQIITPKAYCLFYRKRTIKSD